MDGPCALRNNGHPSQSEDAWLNGAQTGGYCAMFRPISFWLTFHWGGMTPMRRLLSPGGSERCYLHSVGAGERGDPSLPNGLGREKANARTDSHISYAHVHSVAPFTPSRALAHFQGNFDTSNYWALGSDRSIPGFNRRTEEKRADSRLELPIGLRQCAGLSELHVCLHLFFPLRAF